MLLFLVVLLALVCYAGALVSVFVTFTLLFAGKDYWTAMYVSYGFIVVGFAFTWLGKDMMKGEDE